MKELKLVFRHPDMPPALNGSKGLLRMHWSKRKQSKTWIQWKIKAECNKIGLKSFPDKVTVHIHNYAILLMDFDNLASRFKIVGDALVNNQVIKNDSPKYIDGFFMDQTRVSKKADVRLEITIKEI